MKAASLSLALTAFYVLLAVYAIEAARVLGPVYAAAVIGLWMFTRPWKHRDG